LTRHLIWDRPGARLVAFLVSAAVGCGGSGGESPDLPPAGPGTSDDVFEDTRATSIQFDVGEELTLMAGQARDIVVRVEPPGRHTVRFALLGKAQDAFLSANLVETEPDGVATTRLTVLGAASDFMLRAAAGRVEGNLHVLTLEANEASLFVSANYDSRRTPELWVASVHLAKTCAQLEGLPFPDGTVSAMSSSRMVEIQRVPADVDLAVVIRGERFAGGCRGIEPLLANTETRIEIDVFDRPMEIANLSLDMGFGVEAATELNPALEWLAFRAASAFTGAGTDLDAVLDAMSARASAPEEFEQARSARGWEALLVTALTSNLAGNGLRTKAQSLMQTGLWRLYEARAFVGQLRAPGSAGTGELVLTSVIGLEPEQAGFGAESAVTVAAEREDYLRIGSTLSWRPAPFLAQAATLTAREEDPLCDSAADALADEFGCEGVAELLADAGAVPGQAYPGCTAACMLALCEAAIDELWARVASVDLPSVPWQFSGSARAEVDENARPRRVEGTWAGSLTVPDFPLEMPGPVPIQGPFSGE